jgi:hypothetical protein
MRDNPGGPSPFNAQSVREAPAFPPSPSGLWRGHALRTAPSAQTTPRRISLRYAQTEAVGSSVFIIDGSALVGRYSVSGLTYEPLAADP